MIMLYSKISLLRPLEIKTTSLFRALIASLKWHFSCDFIFDPKTTSLIRPFLGSQKSGLNTGLPWSGKNIWKMKFFPGQGKVREFCGWSGKFKKDLDSQ